MLAYTVSANSIRTERESVAVAETIAAFAAGVVVPRSSLVAVVVPQVVGELVALAVEPDAVAGGAQVRPRAEQHAQRARVAVDGEHPGTADLVDRTAVEGGVRRPGGAARDPDELGEVVGVAGDELPDLLRQRGVEGDLERPAVDGPDVADEQLPVVLSVRTRHLRSARSTRPRGTHHRPEQGICARAAGAGVSLGFRIAAGQQVGQRLLPTGAGAARSASSCEDRRGARDLLAVRLADETFISTDIAQPSHHCALSDVVRCHRLHLLDDQANRLGLTTRGTP
ncbi:hypothetical protein [Streptosporangium sp. NPDC087985]|uniref:hypothetical protein n=1 Tax=Streptosporangium sp. NPDC087985 TaxID=3366196 RepID=UPI0038048E9C